MMIVVMIELKIVNIMTMITARVVEMTTNSIRRYLIFVLVLQSVQYKQILFQHVEN